MTAIAGLFGDLLHANYAPILADSPWPIRTKIGALMLALKPPARIDRPRASNPSKAKGRAILTQRREKIMDEIQRAALTAMAKEVGRHIDPTTAEVKWEWRGADDYANYPDTPDSYLGRAYFARTPGSEAWVRFGDLPKATRNELWKLHQHKLLFPAGLDEARRRITERLGVEPEQFREEQRTLTIVIRKCVFGYEGPDSGSDDGAPF